MTSIASTLPDPGSPSFPAILGALGAFVGTSISLLNRQTREDVQWNAFITGFFGTGAGLIIYVFAFFTDLY